MAKLLPGDFTLQRPGYMLLANEVSEALGPVLAVEGLGAHRRPSVAQDSGVGNALFGMLGLGIWKFSPLSPGGFAPGSTEL